MKKVNDSDLINWWLEKYHNTNLDKIKETHPEWKNAEDAFVLMQENLKDFSPEQQMEISDNMHKASREFYETYAVTDAQHDEWNAWAKEYVRKVTKMSKKYIDRAWWSVYLNCSPQIINEKEIV